MGTGAVERGPGRLVVTTERVSPAAAQAQRNAALVERLVGQVVGPVPTWPVVVLWPSDPDLEVQQVDGVAVLPGPELRTWIDSLPDDVVDDDHVAEAWPFLCRHIATRDAKDLEVQGALPRSPIEYLRDLASYPIGALAGLFGLTVVGGLAGWPIVLLPGVLIAGATCWAQRFPPVRRFATGAFLMTGGALLAMVALAVADAVVG